MLMVVLMPALSFAADFGEITGRKYPDADVVTVEERECVSYNPDGTINIYIPTDFASEDPRVYYEVVLGGQSYRFTESLARIEGIENTTYPLEYRVCIDDENGMKYVLWSTSVSGVVNDDYRAISLSAEDGRVTVGIFAGLEQLGEVLRLVINGGEAIRFRSSDILYSEEAGGYLYTVEYAGEVLSASLEFSWMFSATHRELAELYGSDAIKGEAFAVYTIEYTQE